MAFEYVYIIIRVPIVQLPPPNYAYGAGTPTLRQNGAWMVTFETDEGTFALPSTLAAAVIRHSTHEADFLAGVMKELGWDKLRLPAAFLLEFAALMELWLWEWQGLRPLLPNTVPTFAEAKKSLFERAAKGPQEFAGQDAQPLSHQIFQVWVENFAWDARDQFGGDLIVKQDDEGEFVDSLAEFLWEHRDQLANVLDNEETPS